MNNNLMDNIMRTLFYKRKEQFVDIAMLYEPDTENASIDAAITELVAMNYVEKIGVCVKITELGESFSLNSSFCFPNKPLIEL